MITSKKVVWLKSGRRKKKIDKVEPKITLLKVINKMVENMILDRIE